MKNNETEGIQSALTEARRETAFEKFVSKVKSAAVPVAAIALTAAAVMVPPVLGVASAVAGGLLTMNRRSGESEKVAVNALAHPEAEKPGIVAGIKQRLANTHSDVTIPGQRWSAAV